MSFCIDCNRMHPYGKHTRPTKLHPTGEPPSMVPPELQMNSKPLGLQITPQPMAPRPQTARESAPETRPTVIVPITVHGEHVCEAATSLRAQLASAEVSERAAIEDSLRWKARVKLLEERLERMAKIARGEA